MVRQGGPVVAATINRYAGLHDLLRHERCYGLEGLAWLMGGVEDWLDDPERREAVPAAPRRIESEPTLLGASGHLLTVGRRQP